MNSPSKVLLGLGTVWPMFYLPLFFLFVFRQALSGGFSAIGFLAIFTLHLFTIAIMLFNIIFYCLHVTGKLKGNRRVTWLILVLLLGPPAMIIYFFKYIWP